jgi:cytochrome P450
VGPIVRITPTELHVDDPDFYDSIYSHSLHLDKLDSFNHRWSSPGSVQTTGPHVLHKVRRAALNPFFSKSQITQLWPNILMQCEKLCSKLEESYADKDIVLSLKRAYFSLSNDVVNDYCFGKSSDQLDLPGFISKLEEINDHFIAQVHVVTHFPFILTFMNACPVWFQLLMKPGIAFVQEYQKVLHFRIANFKSLLTLTLQDLRKQIKLVMNRKEKGAEQPSHKTIFHDILDSKLPREEITLKRLQDEALVVVSAGTHTVTFALSVASFHILNNPEILRKLREELVTAIPDRNQTLTWPQLEALPYLGAVIQESKLLVTYERVMLIVYKGLRLSYGTVQRSPRITPSPPLQYNTYIIPPGFAIGMDPMHTHHNEAIFPDSYTFNPDRWLNANSAALRKHNIAFSKGTRQCVGMNLAYAELYLTLSMMFRRFEMELFETDESAVRITSEFFVPRPMNGKSVKVKVKSLRS